MPDCVLQPWVMKLTWMEQSALLTSVRGCDSEYNQHVRAIVRYLRRSILFDANVDDGVFVKYGTLPSKKELKQAIEYMSIHFVSHLMHGLQIIGYKAKDETTRSIASDYYEMFCDILHCNPESEEQMNLRLKDNRELIEEQNTSEKDGITK